MENARWVSIEIKSKHATQRATQHGAPDGDGMRPAQDLGYRSRENGSDAAADRDPCQLFWINHGSHLIVGGDLWGMFGVGGNWVLPAYAATAGEKSSFTTRLEPAR
jgi:hypothetical protein